MILGGDTSHAERTHHATQNDRSGTLDIVVEAEILVLIPSQGWEGIFEIFELYDNSRISVAC